MWYLASILPSTVHVEPNSGKIQEPNRVRGKLATRLSGFLGHGHVVDEAIMVQHAKEALQHAVIYHIQHGSLCSLTDQGQQRMGESADDGAGTWAARSADGVCCSFNRTHR